MASVNLWELITKIAHIDAPNSDRCKMIEQYTGPRFGTEYSLEINEVTGVQTLCIFNHEDHEVSVTLAVNPDGFLSVTRCRKSGDVSETRKVSF